MPIAPSGFFCSTLQSEMPACFTFLLPSSNAGMLFFQQPSCASSMSDSACDAKSRSSSPITRPRSCSDLSTSGNVPVIKRLAVPQKMPSPVLPVLRPHVLVGSVSSQPSPFLPTVRPLCNWQRRYDHNKQAQMQQQYSSIYPQPRLTAHQLLQVQLYQQQQQKLQQQSLTEHHHSKRQGPHSRHSFFQERQSPSLQKNTSKKLRIDGEEGLLYTLSTESDCHPETVVSSSDEDITLSHLSVSFFIQNSVCR